ncbi:MAG: hypothetical protein ACPGVU_09765 [Limisphaerales bacterium]
MKTSSLNIPLLAAIAIVGLAVGCGDKEPEIDENAIVEPEEPVLPPKPPTPDERPAPNVQPAVDSSFVDVAKKLDTGGSAFAYLSTAQWVQRLSQQVETVGAMVEEITRTSNFASQEQSFKVVKRIVERGGLQEVAGMGYSAFSPESGAHRSKTYLHRKAGASGYLWKIAPPVDDVLYGVDLLPKGTVYATFANLDYAAAWQILSDEIAIVGTPEVQESFSKSQEEMKKAVGMDVSELLGGITDGIGIIVTSNPEDQLTLGDTNTGKAYKIDRPDFALVIGTRDSRIYDSFRTEFGEKEGNKQVIEGKLRMLVMDPLNENNKDWRWTLGFDGEHLMFSTGESILKGIANAKAGEGLNKEDAFGLLAADAPQMGRVFSYSSDRLASLQRDLHLHMTKLEETEMAGFVHGFLEVMHPGGSSYSAMQSSNDGWLWTTMSTEEPARQMLNSSFIKPMKLVATVAIPSFKAGKARAERNTCHKNQEKIDSAKKQWGERVRGNPNAVPSTRSLVRILKVMPSCPSGGTYQPRSISEICTCTHPGHARD